MKIIREENPSKGCLYRCGYYNPDNLSNFILHCEEGPAVEYADGYQAWMQNDKYHRLNGPAIFYKTDKIWYFHGEEAAVKSQEEFEKWIKLRNF